MDYGCARVGSSVSESKRRACGRCGSLVWPGEATCAACGTATAEPTPKWLGVRTVDEQIARFCFVARTTGSQRWWLRIPILAVTAGVLTLVAGVVAIWRSPLPVAARLVILVLIAFAGWNAVLSRGAPADRSLSTVPPRVADTETPAPPPPPPAINILFVDGNAPLGIPVTVRAQVVGLPAGVTGTVEYVVFAAPGCAGTPSRRAGVRPLDGTDAAASDPVIFESIGRVWWRAHYAGTAATALSSECTQMLVERRRPQLRVEVAPTVTTGTPVNATAELVAQAPVTGSLAYTAHNDSRCADAGVPAGTQPARVGALDASTALTFRNAAPVYWRASYSGDAENEPHSACVAQTVVQAPPAALPGLSVSAALAHARAASLDCLDLTSGQRSGTWACARADLPRVQTSRPGAVYFVSIRIRDSSVISIRANVTQSGTIDAEPAARDFLAYVASVPHTGAQTAAVVSWVGANFGALNLVAGFGTAEFEMLSDPDRKFWGFEMRGR